MPTFTKRFALNFSSDGIELSMSRSQYERIEAEQWKIDRGEKYNRNYNPLKKIRGFPELEGMRVYYERKLGGEISFGPGQRSSPQIRHYQQAMAKIDAEIRRRRAAKSDAPANESRPALDRPRKKSPGRHTNASRQINLKDPNRSAAVGSVQSARRKG